MKELRKWKPEKAGRQVCVLKLVKKTSDSIGLQELFGLESPRIFWEDSMESFVLGRISDKFTNSCYKPRQVSIIFVK